MELVEFLDDVPGAFIALVFIVSAFLTWAGFKLTMEAVDGGSTPQIVAWCIATSLMFIIAALSLVYGFLRIVQW